MSASKGSRRSARGTGAKKPSAPAGRGPEDSEFRRLERLLQLMREHDLVELEIGPDGQSLRMSKTGAAAFAAASSAPGGVPAAAPSPAHAAAKNAANASDAAAKETPAEGDQFVSPMVGTFYRAPSPEAKPFVTEGDLVKADTTLCLIEAMKVMNEIKAERSGKVVQILAENGEAVEYGQPLFVIQRAD